MQSFGFDDILQRLDDIERDIRDELRIGMERGASIIESDGKATTAYKGMSGATRAGTVAYVADSQDNGLSHFGEALDAASALLSGFRGHFGQPHEESIGSVGSDEIVIIYTVPTDYIDKIETGNGGEKAFLEDTFNVAAPQVIEEVAQAVAVLLR